MVSINSLIQKKTNIIESNFEDCIMIYDIENSNYYVLNKVGSIIWGLLKENQGEQIQDIINILISLYPSNNNIKIDVLQFVDLMLKKGIILIGG